MRLFTDVSSQVANTYLARAAELAERARGATAPNPLVGCVVVRDGSIVGEGFHARAGEPHAEVLALREAGDAARGSEVFVTLEPCAHHGRTPPCCDALIAAGVSRVTVGMPDPNPEAGGGARRLRDAGVDVEFAEDSSPFESMNEGWLHRVRTGMPLVTAKVGISLDARLAFEPVRRASMTGPSGSEVTRRLRASADAVLVSAATVTADDPELTVRDVGGVRAQMQPLRVVLARSFVPAASSRIFTDGFGPVTVLASELADEHALNQMPDGVEVRRWESGDGLVGAFRILAESGVGELLVEPGTRLLSAMWESECLDRFVAVSAGGMGGDSAQTLYVGEADRDGERLVRRTFPLEAGIVGDVSVTVWSRCGGFDEA